MRATSDLDVLAVVDGATTGDQRKQLRDRLLPLSGPPRRHTTLRPVEVTVVRQGDVNPWRYPPRQEFLFGEWLRPEYDKGLVPGPEENADVATLLATVRIGNRALVGPPPAEVLPPVPAADLRRAIVEGMAEWTGPRKVETDTRNMLLALSRIWHTLSTGEIVRKDVAARWAADQLDPPGSQVVGRARQQYLRGTHGERTWPSRMEEVRATVAAIVREIDALVSRPPGPSG